MKDTFKTALTAAVVASAITAGAAIATTQAFTLGATNRVDAPSRVTNVQANGTTVNPVDAPLLTLENKSTTANATPLSLVVAGNHAPLKVNTGVKVTNLKADRLDGFDSTGFVQGRGTFVANRIVVPSGQAKSDFLTVPGLGTLGAYCISGPASVWSNNTTSDIDTWYLDGVTGLFLAQVSPPGGQVQVAGPTHPGGQIGLGTGSDPGPRRTAFLRVYAFQNGPPDAPCSFQVEGTLWTSQ